MLSHASDSGAAGRRRLRGLGARRAHVDLFAIFYVDDAYLASRDAEFLQRALDLRVSLFGRVGLETNVTKMQTMICTPGRIRTQLPADSYRRLQRGRVTAAEWNARDVKCLSAERR
jgi:hypothetical protein